MNQLRQDKDFPVYKDWLNAELMACKITDTEYNQLVKDADTKGTLFNRRNRAALQQIYKNMVDNRRLTETERHNEATEDIQQQNADTRKGQLGVAQQNADTNAGKAEAGKRLNAEKIIEQGLKNGTWVRFDKGDGNTVVIPKKRLPEFKKEYKKSKVIN